MSWTIAEKEGESICCLPHVDGSTASGENGAIISMFSEEEERLTNDIFKKKFTKKGGLYYQIKVAPRARCTPFMISEVDNNQTPTNKT